MKLGSMKNGPQTNKPKLTVAAAFNQDSDEEPEIMPPEARMRMRNIGRCINRILFVFISNNSHSGTRQHRLDQIHSVKRNKAFQMPRNYSKRTSKKRWKVPLLMINQNKNEIRYKYLLY